MNARNYTEATRKALFALSLGRCYEPDCQEPVVRMDENGSPVVMVQIAHVCAAKEGGPRWDKSMDDDARRAFTNLLLLCTYHHKLVDTLPTGLRYDVKTLMAWKTSREGGIATDLSGLTEDRLIDILGSTLEGVIIDTKTELLDAIDQVELVSRESAGLLRTLVDEIFKRPHLDPDAVASLTDSANTLKGVADYAPMLLDSSRSLSHSLPDYAPMLARSSSELRELPDYAGMLAWSSQSLRDLPDMAGVLRDAAKGLDHLPDYAPMLADSCATLAKVPDHIGALRAVADEVEEAAETAASRIEFALRKVDQLGQNGYTAELHGAAESVAASADQIRNALAGEIPDRWTYILRGIIAGLVIAGVVVALGIWYLVAR